MKKENIDYIKLIGILALIISSVIGYQNLVSIPREKLEEQKRIETEKSINQMIAKQAYSNCVDLAFDNYETNWNIRCKDQGLEEDCNLPYFLSEDLFEKLDNMKTKTCKIEAEMSL